MELRSNAVVTAMTEFDHRNKKMTCYGGGDLPDRKKYDHAIGRPMTIIPGNLQRYHNHGPSGAQDDLADIIDLLTDNFRRQWIGGYFLRGKLVPAAPQTVR